MDSSLSLRIPAEAVGSEGCLGEIMSYCLVSRKQAQSILALVE